MQQQRLTEKKPSTLNNHSSLLAIYNVLHYITIPLACSHLHIPVTSLQRLLIINGSHMLPGAPYYRIITATQKAKKNGNYVDMKWSTKPIKGYAIIDGVSQFHCLTERVSFTPGSYAFSLTTICRLKPSLLSAFLRFFPHKYMYRLCSVFMAEPPTQQKLFH